MPARRHSRFPARRTAGSVVLLVLVTVLLAAFMITKFVQRAGTELLADARAGDQERLRREAYSALETTLAVLADVRAVDQGLFNPAQGWSDPLGYAGHVPGPGTSVEVAFEDESGRISLPKADAATLEALLELTGVDRNQAERASDALLVWMHADYVPPTLEADPGSYEREAIPHKAAGRPLRSLDELASIAIVRDLFFDEQGRPYPRLREFAAAVSLQAFDRVNLNAGTPLALTAAGATVDQVEALRTYLRTPSRGRPYFKNAQEAAAVMGSAAPTDRFGVEIQVLRINVTARAGALAYRISAVVSLSGATTAPVRGARAGAANPTGPAGDAEKAPLTLKKLDYPFKVLDLLEDVESGPASSDRPAGND